MKRLVKVQNDLKAPKNQINKFGNYKYRSAEDILTAVKHLLADNDLSMTIADDICCMPNGWVYVKATVKVFDAETKDLIAENTAFARESESKKGMDVSQITGTASSYARKYAMNGMFLIDDNKDADTDEFEEQSKPSKSTIDAKIKLAEIKDVDKLYQSYGVKEYSELTSKQANDLESKLDKQIKAIKKEEN